MFAILWDLYFFFFFFYTWTEEGWSDCCSVPSGSTPVFKKGCVVVQPINVVKKKQTPSNVSKRGPIATEAVKQSFPPCYRLRVW